MRTLDLYDLHKEDVLEKLEIGKLLNEDIEEISQDNIGEVEDILSEDKVSEIKNMLKVNNEEKLIEKAQQYLEKIKKEPKEVLTDSEGNFAGYRYGVKEKIGSVTYKDVHVRLSEKEDTIYFGSLWYENKEGDIRKFNYEVTNDGQINFHKRIGSRYYRQVIELAEKVIDWFEEKIKEEGIEIDKEDKEVTEKEAEKALEKVTQGK